MRVFFFAASSLLIYYSMRLSCVAEVLTCWYNHISFCFFLYNWFYLPCHGTAVHWDSRVRPLQQQLWKNNHTAEGTSCGFVQGTRAKETALIKLSASLCCHLVGRRQLKCMCVAITSRQLFYSTNWHFLALWPLHLILSIINVVHSSSLMEVSWYL